MEDYSNYRKELDPFSIEFNATKTLAELDVSGPSSFSIDEFEKELINNEKTINLVNQLKMLDSTKETKTKIISDRARRKMIRQKIEDDKNQQIFERTKIEYFSGTGFALFHGGPYNRLRKWVCDRTRVTIKLHANRCLQCVISAYDKHQNLLVRDCDEVYIPSKRIGLVQTCPNAMPAKFKYEQLNGTNILSRYLKSSIIMGSSIICIYDDSQ